MTRTQRTNMLNDVISDRIHSAAYKAWFTLSLKPTETGTIFKTINRLK